MTLEEFRHRIDNIPLDFDDFSVVISENPLTRKYVSPNTVKYNFYEKLIQICKYE